MWVKGYSRSLKMACAIWYRPYIRLSILVGHYKYRSVLYRFRVSCVE